MYVLTVATRCTTFDGVLIDQPMTVWEEHQPNLEAAVSEDEARVAIEPIIWDIVRFERFALHKAGQRDDGVEVVVSEMDPTVEDLLLTYGPELSHLSEKQIREEIKAAHFDYLEPSQHSSSELSLSTSKWGWLDEL